MSYFLRLYPNTYDLSYIHPLIHIHGLFSQHLELRIQVYKIKVWLKL